MMGWYTAGALWAIGALMGYDLMQDEGKGADSRVRRSVLLGFVLLWPVVVVLAAAHTAWEDALYPAGRRIAYRLRRR